VDILKLDPNEDDEYAEEAEIEAEIEEEELGLAAPTKPAFTSRKSFKAGLGALFVYTLVLIGNTIGALVTLNGAIPIEFGQGTVATLPCDQDGITVSAQSRMDTSTTPISFNLASIKLSNISDECINNEFKIVIYDKDGNKVKLGYKNIVGVTTEDAEMARIILTRTASQSDGIDWRVFPASALPNPLSETGLTICGGEFDLSETIDYDWGTSVPKPGCPPDNYLVHWRGFILVPGSDNGQSNQVRFTLSSYGNSVLQVNNKTVVSDRDPHGYGEASGSINLRNGKAYPINLWMFVGTGAGKVALDWDIGSGSVIPASGFQYDSSVGIQIATSEGSTDYSTTASTWVTDNRSFYINFLRKMTSDEVYKIAIETS
jgi:hypothetical protein